MSKVVKNLVTEELRHELAGVEALLLVNVVGLSANNTMTLRRTLREKDIKLIVVKNSLARRATEGTVLAPAFEGSQGTLAMVWGASDVVALAKEVMQLSRKPQYQAFQARGGVMDGAKLAPEQVVDISKWPTREEQLSILMGQILSPGAKLASQLIAVGGALASQIKQCAEGEDEEAAPAAAGEPENTSP